jgi:peptidoglycan/LPS O-acetylase OafA/YrhL
MPFSFRTLAIAASGIFFALALIWLLVPQFILWVWQIDSPEPALLLARRGGALFLGIAVMLCLVRNAENSPARRAIAIGLSVACSMLAALSLYELVTRHAGTAIGLAILVEIALALAFAAVCHADNSSRNS